MNLKPWCNHLPESWSLSLNDLGAGEDYRMVKLTENSSVYEDFRNKMTMAYCSISKVVRVESPYLYWQFLVNTEEYESRIASPYSIRKLYHDTGASNIPSILSSNLDRRLVRRAKFGKGVSFSPDPTYANQFSSMYNGINRAMIRADVLVGDYQTASYSNHELPDKGYDTTTGNDCKVYVKYYDNEFYPHYIAFYESR